MAAGRAAAKALEGAHLDHLGRDDAGRDGDDSVAGDHEHGGKRAAGRGVRGDVPVAHGGQRDDRPVDGGRDAGEAVFGPLDQVPARAWSAGDRFPRRRSRPATSGSRQEVEGDPEDQVDGDQLDAFEPVGFPVGRDEREDRHRDRNRDHLEGREAQVHGLAHEVTREDQDRRDEERNLDARTDRDVHREIHLVLHGDEDRGAVLGRVADDRNQDDADEDLGHAEAMRGLLDGTDEELAHDGHERGRDEQHERGSQVASSGAWRGAGARVAARPLVALEPLLEGALAGVEVSVGAERERKAQQVDDEQDDRDFQAQGLLPHLGVSAGDHVEDRRHHQPHDREGEQRRAGARRDPVELLPLVFGPAGEGGDAEHEQDVADDRPGERCLHHVVQPGPQGGQRDDELGGVAEGRVQEPAHARTESLGDVLGRAAHPARKRHDGDRRRREDPDRVGVTRLERDRDRDEGEQRVDGAKFESCDLEGHRVFPRLLRIRKRERRLYRPRRVPSPRNGGGIADGRKRRAYAGSCGEVARATASREKIAARESWAPTVLAVKASTSGRLGLLPESDFNTTVEDRECQST